MILVCAFHGKTGVGVSKTGVGESKTGVGGSEIHNKKNVAETHI